MPALARALSLAAVVISACAPPAAPRAAAPPVVAIARPAPAIAAAEPARPGTKAAPLSRAEAVARGRQLAEEWSKAEGLGEPERAAWIARAAGDEGDVRRVIEAIFADCLGSTEDRPAACELQGDDAPLAETLFERLRETGDPAAPGGPSLRLFVRLSTRGAWRAEVVLGRLLERRMQASLGPCAPPTAAEIEAARGDLDDLAVTLPRRSPSGAVEARWPTEAERDDLAYLYAVVGDAGPEVGSAREDTSAPPLAEGHPDLAARARLREAERAALRAGDLEGHARAAEAYLRTLGYPGPLRLAEESDARWGGAGASYLLRDLARSAEILGRYAIAEALYRRAQPGGGMCGTSTPSVRRGQIEGAIRAAELGRGCRPVAAERLYAVSTHAPHSYDPDRLALAGFDVPRLYGAALMLLGREEPARLERALAALPERSADALARLARRGPEAWGARVRALPGYADAAGGQAVGRLLAIAEDGADEARTAAIAALGSIARDRGWDPCIPTVVMRGFGHSGSLHERRVRGVMDRCATRLDAAAIRRLVTRVAKLAGDPSPAVREAAAHALGHLGAPTARGTLVALTRDPFDAGGERCTSTDSGPPTCERNRPVAFAAREALTALAKADAMRAEQQRTPRRKKR